MSSQQVPEIIESEASSTTSTSDASDSSDEHEQAIADLRRQMENLGSQITSLEGLISRFNTERNPTGVMLASALLGTGNVGTSEDVRQRPPPLQQFPVQPDSSTVQRRFVINSTIRINPINISGTMTAPTLTLPKKPRSKFQKVGSRKSSFHKYMKHYMNVSGTKKGGLPRVSR